MNKEKYLFIAGYYGFGNLGDEAVLESMLADLRYLHPDLKFIVASEDPKATAAMYEIDSVSWRDTGAVLDAIERSNAVLLGGGGAISVSGLYNPNLLLTEGHNDFSCFKFSLPVMAYLAKKPFMIYAVGTHLGTHRAAWQHIVLSTEIADVVTLRDRTSKTILNAFGCDTSKARVTADAAFSLKPAAPTHVKEILKREGITAQGPMLGVVLRHSDSCSSVQWEQEVATALQRFARTHRAFILLIPFSKNKHSPENDDLVVAERVRACIGPSVECTVLRENLLPSEVAGVLASCDVVLGMRFHSLVLAINGHVPCVSLVYDYNDPKIIGLMSKMRLRHLQIDIASITGRQVFLALERAYSSRCHLQKRLQGVQTKLAAKARINARLALRLLDSKPKPRFLKIRRVMQELTWRKLTQLSRAQKQARLLSSLLRRLIDNREFEVAARLLELLPSEEERQAYSDPEWNYLVAFLFHTHKRDLPKALHHYDLALKCGFNEFWIRYNRGALYLELGNLTQARLDLTRVVALNPTHEGAQEMLQMLEKKEASNDG